MIYHNITARYNGYFNADFKQLERMKEIRLNLVDRYDSIIPVFPFGDDAAAKASFLIMDETIKKASIVIQKHEISKWTDDCYLLIGRGYFLKKQYFEAIENFQYVFTKYKTSEIAPLALIWSANAFIGAKQTSSAISALEAAKIHPQLTDKQKPFLFATYASYYIAVGNYEDAAKSLEKCLSFKLNKYTRSRYNFLLGQLYQKAGKNAKAASYYRLSLKGNPPYDMEFNAKLNLIRLFEKGNDYEVRRLLTGMIKEVKNKSNLDQLYLELAILDQKQKKYDAALSNYKLAAWNATVNQGIKGTAYLKAADLYFDRSDYASAQMYYDSCAAFLPKSHPEYNKAVAKKESLAEIVKLLNEIHDGDSLLRLTTYKKEDLKKLAEKKLKDDKARELAEQKKAKETEKNTGIADLNGGGNSGDQTANASTWAFENPSAKSLGYSEFKRKWGDRPNEDDWRRSKKAPSESSGNANAQLGNTQPKDSTEKVDPAKANEAEVTALVDAVPTKPEAIEALKNKVVEAYFTLGMIYRDRLKDSKESTKAFETLLQKYPASKYEKESWFNLYLIYEEQKNKPKADYYKNLLLKDSTSRYAKLVLGIPLGQEDDENSRANKAYEKAFASYKNGNYREAQANCNNAISTFPKSDLIPRFELLAAICSVKTSSKEEAEKALTKVATTYPSNPVKNVAEDYLAVLRKGPQALNSSTTKTDSSGNKSTSAKPEESGKIYVIGIPMTKPDFDTLWFKNRFNEEHMVLVIADMSQDGYLEMKPDLRIAQFNDKNFSIQELQVTSSLIGNKYQVFIVRSFKDKTKATYYQEMAAQNAELMKNTDTDKTMVVAISQTNLATLFRTGKLEEYLRYYAAYYPNQ